MADVFISYKREERAQVERIAERLRGLGLSVWFDARLPSGTSFDEEINRELQAAKCVLVCWSPGAVQSQWVRAEAAIGRDRDVLAAVTLAPTTLYPPFNLIHSIDLADWDGADLHPGWLGVIGRIGALADRPDLVERAGRYAAVSAAAGDDAVKRVTVEKRGPQAVGKGGWGLRAAIAAAAVVGIAVVGWMVWNRGVVGETLAERDARLAGAAPHAVISEGVGTYGGRNLDDLDPAAEGTGYDMVYEPDAEGVWRLSAAHPWGAVLAGPDMPTYEECEAARKVERATFIVDADAVGSVLCLNTNGNRRAAIQILSAPGPDGEVGFHYVVWAEE